MNWVGKTWGAEQWIVNNELYCMKFLHVTPGFQSSMHRHLLKDETFYVREGAIRLEVGEEEPIILRPSDEFRIAPGTWHRFANHPKWAMALVIEVSTHHDDADVERRELSGPIE